MWYTIFSYMFSTAKMSADDLNQPALFDTILNPTDIFDAIYMQAIFFTTEKGCTILQVQPFEYNSWGMKTSAGSVDPDLSFPSLVRWQHKAAFTPYRTPALVKGDI